MSPGPREVVIPRCACRILLCIRDPKPTQLTVTVSKAVNQTLSVQYIESPPESPMHSATRIHVCYPTAHCQVCVAPWSVIKLSLVMSCAFLVGPKFNRRLLFLGHGQSVHIIKTFNSWQAIFYLTVLSRYCLYTIQDLKNNTVHRCSSSAPCDLLEFERN